MVRTIEEIRGRTVMPADSAPVSNSNLLLYSCCVILSWEILYRLVHYFKVGYGFVKARTDDIGFFKWRDFMCKLLFATIVSTWTVYCIFVYDFASNPNAKYPASSYLIIFTSAYFMHHIAKFSSWFRLRYPGFIMHHLMIVIGGPTVVWLNKHHSFMVICFLVVIPDIFLEIRCLMFMNNKVHTVLYTRMKQLLILSTIIVRFPTDLFLLRYLYIYYNTEDLFLFFQGLCCTLFALFYHTYVFVCLLKSKQ